MSNACARWTGVGAIPCPAPTVQVSTKCTKSAEGIDPIVRGCVVGTAPSIARKDPAGVSASVLSPKRPAQSTTVAIVAKVISSASVGSAAILVSWDADSPSAREQDFFVLWCFPLAAAAQAEPDHRRCQNQGCQKEASRRAGNLDSNTVSFDNVSGGEDQRTNAPM